MRLYSMIWAFTTLMLALPAAQAQQVDAKVIASVPGSCVLSAFDGTSASCSSNGVVFMLLRNDRALLTVATERGIVMFVSDTQHEPNAESYEMNIVRVRFQDSGDQVADVRGTCRVQRSATDKFVWDRILCDVRDDRDRSMTMAFRGNGQRSEVTNIR